MRHLYCLVAALTLTVSSLLAQSYPTSFSIYTNSPVCTGQSFLFSVGYSNPPSGTSVSFRWTGPTGFTNSNAYGTLSVPASATTAGVYSVTMTFSGTNQGTATASTTVSLGTSKPMALVNDGQYYVPGRSICSPTSLSLAAYPDELRSNNSATYRWTGPNNFSSTEQNPVVTQGVAGLYILEATYSTTCGVGKDTVQVYNSTLSVNAGTYPIGSTSQSSTAFCSGAGIEFRASSFPPSNTTVAYQWSGPNGFISAGQSFTLTNATPEMAGLYNVTATFSGNCSGTATTNRQVQISKPAVIFSSRSTDGLSSGNQYCPGTSFNLSATFFNSPPNFPNSQSTLTYRWSGPNGFTSSDQQPTLPTASTLASGLYSLTVTVAGMCSGSYTDTGEIDIGKPISYVSAYPLRGIAQNDTYCPGATVVLAASNSPSSSSVTSYRWHGPNGFTSSAQSLTLATIVPEMAGVYSLTTVYGGQCASTRVSFANILVNTPSVYGGVFKADGAGGGNSPLCLGNYYILAPNAFVYNLNDLRTNNSHTFEWTLPDGTTTTSPSLTITNANLGHAGRYSLKTTLGGGCTAAVTRDTTDIVVGIAPPKIRASNPFITSGRSTTLFAENCSGSTIQWSDGQTGSTITVTPTQTTTYLATCVGYEGCLSPLSVPLTVQVSNQPEADLSLKFSVSNQAPAPGQPVTVTVAIKNSSGQEARNVQLVSRLPATLSIINAGAFQANGLVLTATLASIPANSTTNLPVQIAATAAGDFALTAQITASDNPDPDSWPASGTNDGQDDTGFVTLRTNVAGTAIRLSPEPYPADLPAPRISKITLPNGWVDLSLAATLNKAVSALNEVVTITLSLNNVENRRLLSPEITCLLPAGLTFVGGTGLVASGQQVTLAGGKYYPQWPQTFSFQARVTGFVKEPIKARISYCDWDDVDSTPTNGFNTGEDDTIQVSLRVR